MTEPLKPYEELCPRCQGTGYHDDELMASGTSRCHECGMRGTKLTEEGHKMLLFLLRWMTPNHLG